MKEFRTKAIINASTDVVYKTITDLSCYPRFDPNCIKIEGILEQGNYISVTSKLAPERLFKVRVSRIVPGELMIWESGLLPFNLFKGIRTFTVIAKDDQTSEFHMVEVFSGPLSKLMSNMVPDMTNAFSEFSKGLKRFIESRP